MPSARLAVHAYRPSAKQIRGVPSQPVIPLYPAVLPEGIEWDLNGVHLAVGLRFEQNGTIAFAPIPVPKMGMKTFIVAVAYKTLDRPADFVLRLRYRDNTEVPHDLYTMKLHCDRDRTELFGFPIPLEELDSSGLGMFTCSLSVEELESSTLLVRNVWVQIEA